uniref:Mitogen-activated protein kinase kinase kinase NPK1 isoform X2 n=1 Tax=Hirondellea gigas TaxID=1518452 RepID=A0A6A7G8H6_9CRUS
MDETTGDINGAPNEAILGEDDVEAPHRPKGRHRRNRTTGSSGDYLERVCQRQRERERTHNRRANSLHAPRKRNFAKAAPTFGRSSSSSLASAADDYVDPVDREPPSITQRAIQPPTISDHRFEPRASRQSRKSLPDLQINSPQLLSQSRLRSRSATELAPLPSPVIVPPTTTTARHPRLGRKPSVSSALRLRSRLSRQCPPPKPPRRLSLVLPPAFNVHTPSSDNRPSSGELFPSGPRHRSSSSSSSSSASGTSASSAELPLILQKSFNSKPNCRTDDEVHQFAQSVPTPSPPVRKKHPHHRHTRSFESIPSTKTHQNSCTVIKNALCDSDGKIRYKRGELIGKGGAGKVYLALAKNGELIAVKQIDLVGSDESSNAQLENEITVMTKLRHPNIVTLYGSERVDETFNILMEFVPGKSMDRLLTSFGPFDEPVIQIYTKQLVDGLTYMHSHCIIHRDLKSRNILVSQTGVCKISDFGSAKEVTEDVKPSVNFTYTPLWLAPEVVREKYNRKADIWSLGCVIIEMATAEKPWAECRFSSPWAALFHIGKAGNVPKIPKTLSPVGQEFLEKCLDRNVAKRPDAADLLNHPWIAHLTESETTPSVGVCI